MTRRRTVLAALTLAVVSIAAATRTDHPPKGERPTADATHPLPLAAVGGDSHVAATGPIIAWIEGVARAEWFAGVAAAEETARIEAARAARSAGVAAPRAGGTCGLDGWAVPDSVLWRESRCVLDAFNATGCGGRGCVGAAQIDRGHFAVVSPWNAGVSGVCADLDAGVIADQQECVRRLSNDGQNLAPWGGA
jgi:hypothetical protein